MKWLAIFVFVLALAASMPLSAAQMAARRPCERGDQRGGCVRPDGSYYKQEDSPQGRRETAEAIERARREAHPYYSRHPERQMPKPRPYVPRNGGQMPI